MLNMKNIPLFIGRNNTEMCYGQELKYINNNQIPQQMKEKSF